MPDLNGIDPTIFSVASSMIQNLSGYVPTISVPLPATILGLSAAYTVTHKATSASPIDAKQAGRRRESMAVIVKPSLTAEIAENAWLDKPTVSVHPEPVEGCVLRA